MKQRRLNAYLKLIQELLTCPRGEEWIRLKQHEDLVDANLVQIMEQIASQLLQEGNRQAAIFLHNWAAKLHHILVKETPSAKPADDKSEAYLSLIQELLACSEDEQETLLADHRDLVGPGLVHKMQQVAQQLQQQGSESSAIYLQNLANELNQAWIEAHAFRPDLQKDLPIVPSAETAAAETTAEPADTPSSLPSTQPVATSLQLEVNQQLATAIAEISQSLRQLNQMIAAQQSTPPNPLWYMEVLERAATAQWILTTDEIEQLIGVKPKCHGKEHTYERGTWTFVKVGKLGAQTAWKVIKTQLVPSVATVDTSDNNGQPKHRQVNAVKPRASLAKHPPLQPTILNNAPEREQSEPLEIPEMEDVWA
ncbi:rough deal protein [Leptolyngbya sp. Heron Island J]|uniref:hypothetical protein n=1 Tax=Leptolyngbya sp. Heron Island J TaxID=1385935 RepID=UPI0003B96B7A|nr:hypothetical protein [Leptolyngbya sp. Heron Island J]ESA35720.1 rough deal protein [Leptolyngbya sp. Heron Island J]